MYISYVCGTCRKEFVLLTEDVEQLPASRYIACPYCNSKHIKKENTADSLKECMQGRSYRRIKGALRQVRQE